MKKKYNRKWKHRGSSGLVMLLLLMFVGMSFGAAHVQTTIRGVVKDEQGEPLGGVTVSVKDSETSTVTSSTGEYIISSNAPIAALVFTAIGYEVVERATEGSQVLDVTLREISQEIEDVVVVGFGTQKRTDMIGSVTSVSPSDLKIPSSNLTTALAGRAAGVIGFQRSGEPGADNADFFIRGVTTFGYKVDPLILIDNVEVTTTDLARLQVDDIETISIMKDA